ncbi:hypothetical protein S83_023652 [Arachis hypogaea]
MSSERRELLAMATKLFELGGVGETPPLPTWPETELLREVFSSSQKRSCSS